MPYEEDIRVPLIIRGPGVPAGTVLPWLASNIDLAPTTAQLAGVDPAELRNLAATADPALVGLLSTRIRSLATCRGDECRRLEATALALPESATR